MVSRPCRRRRPSSRDDGGVSGLFSSGGPRVRFLTRYDGEVSEPLGGRHGGWERPLCALLGPKGSASWAWWRGRTTSKGTRTAWSSPPLFLCKREVLSRRECFRTLIYLEMTQFFSTLSSLSLAQDRNSGNQNTWRNDCKFSSVQLLSRV